MLGIVDRRIARDVPAKNLRQNVLDSQLQPQLWLNKMKIQLAQITEKFKGR